ncbi:MAG: hypothetical protein LBM77_05160 [Spirochaetaceae bacterium]|jgi:hypothetical protein|nr:hypothetical protein [Spirochaetaceae bacterium]
MRQRIGTVKYTPAPPDIAEAMKYAVPLTPEEEAELLMEPDELPMPERKKKVTIMLDNNSIAIFKKVALAHHVHYQTLIRKAVSACAKKYQKEFA